MCNPKGTGQCLPLHARAAQRWRIVHWNSQHLETAFGFDVDENLEKCSREHMRITCSKQDSRRVSESCSMHINCLAPC